jgi:branched-chain amino acid transport system ATP-binding protein
MLQVENLRKAYDKFQAVNGANLVVDEGALVAVIGPNGAGKTTLFKLITGQVTPDTGRVMFRGENIAGLAPHTINQRGIAMAFQIANIFPRMTVFENVQVAVLAQKKQSSNLFRPARNMLVTETNALLERTGLTSQARRLAAALSHGDQKILEIAIALGSDPRLLILDEPTAGMSPEETHTTMELVKRLAKEHGITILFCEHDMQVVFSVATSIMVMRQGQTIIQDKPEIVRENAIVQSAYLGGAHAQG